MLENPALESNAFMSQVHWQASDINSLIRLVEQDLDEHSYQKVYLLSMNHLAP